MSTEPSGYNLDLGSQVTLLDRIVRESDLLGAVLEKATVLALPGWYLGAGCIAQTVWNRAFGLPAFHGIKDVDLVYFDPTDLSPDAEKQRAASVREAMGDFPVELDVKNEAAVHLWYENQFGYGIPPYTSCEDAINTWPITATSIGVSIRDGRFVVYAPFGLNDLFGLVVRPNKAQITENIYVAKVKRWASLWPELTIVPGSGV